MKWWNEYKRQWDITTDLDGGINKVGGDGATLKNRQFGFLLDSGLKPSDKFLDIGCGCLRGTIKVLDYLNEGNFYGIDIAKGLIDLIPEQMSRENVKKKPKIKVNSDFRIKKYFPKVKFDCISAYSLVTHLYPEDTERLFKGVSEALKDDGVFYFTYFPVANDIDSFIPGRFEYSKKWIIEAGEKNGLSLEDITMNPFNKGPDYQQLIIAKKIKI